MARYMPTLEVPRVAEVPSGNITGQEWVPVKGAAERSRTQRYDVREWGDPTTGDAGAVFNAARADVAAIGGGTIIAPAGEYAFTTGVELADGVHIVLPGIGSTHLDFSGLTDPVGGIRPSAIYGAGTRTALPDLGATATVNSRTITLASAPATPLQPGDVIQIYNPENYSFSPYRNYYRDGEFARVLSASGASVTLTRPLMSTYPTTCEVYHVRPIRTGVQGASMSFPDAAKGILTMFGSQLTFGNLELRDSVLSQIEFNACYDFAVRGIDARCYKPTTGLGYGMTIAACQDFVVDACFGEADHHGLTTTNGNGGPNRRGKITNSTFGNLNASGAGGLGMHGNAEYITIEGCELPTGVGLAGDHLILQGCRVGSGALGRCIGTGELLGADIAILDNEIRPTMPHPTNDAYIRLIWSLSQHGSGHDWTINRTGGVLRIARNTLYMGAFVAAGGTTAGVLINNNEALPQSNDLIIEDNDILHEIPVGTDVWSIRCHRNGNGRGFRRVDIDRNTTNAMISLNGIGVTRTRVRGNDVSRTNSVGISIIDNSIAGASTAAIIEYAGNITNENQDGGAGIQKVSGGTLTLIVDGNTSLANNQSAAGGSTRGAFTIDGANTTIYRHNTIGDHQPTPTIVILDRIRDTAMLIEENNTVVGGVVTRDRQGVAANRFRGSGHQDPDGAIVADVGSTYTSFGNGLTYRKASGTGTTGWVALADAP